MGVGTQPPIRTLAEAWNNALCDILDNGFDPADAEDPAEMLLHRKAFYLGALAVLAALHNGASRDDLHDEILAVYPKR